ncbi:UNVERIFIED_CONTAM: Reticulon-like protein B12 [Sesamum angustifolium]|uniref:Reticulon-like protein n=1 Tax=Sesamum angustifolium TaxID=2727405 RepID=A0AAW2N5B8_9LAMI
MSSSDRLFNRHRTVHQILGGGLVSYSCLLSTKSDLEVDLVPLANEFYASSVFLLLFTILFLWAKSAAILNRPAPPLPHLHLSEETANEAATFIRNHINTLLSVFEDIAHGRDSGMYIKVALSLLLISVIGSLTDFFTLGYTCLVLVLTVPAIYERYEDHIDAYALTGYKKLQELYVRLDEVCITKVHKWILEKKKLS